MTTSPSAERAAVRSLSAVALHQVAQLAGGLLFVAFVPRALGADLYGRFAFAFALINIFQMIGELGFQEIFSRFAPEAQARAGPAAIRGMARPLFAAKFVAGLALGALAVAAARGLVGWWTGTELGLIGFSVAARIWATGPYALLLGVGQTAKWAVENTWRQLILATLILLAFPGRTLTFTLTALAAHEVVFLLLGAGWALRSVLGPATRLPGLEAWALLRFGLAFMLANVALVVMFRLSPIVVELLTGSTREVGYFDLALGALLLMYLFMNQAAYAFVPILTQLGLAGRAAEVEQMLGRFVRYTGVLVALGAGGLWAIAGPIAPGLFGPGFEPASGAIRAIAVGLLPLPVMWAASMLSMLEKRPSARVWASLVGLGTFLLGAVLLRGGASAGVALAFGLGLTGGAAGFGRDALRCARAGGAGGWLAVAGAGLFTPLLIWRSDSLPASLVAWAAIAAVYLLLCLAARVFSLSDLRRLIAYAR